MCRLALYPLMILCLPSYRERGLLWDLSSSFSCHIITFVKCSKKIRQLTLLGSTFRRWAFSFLFPDVCYLGLGGIVHVHYHHCSLWPPFRAALYRYIVNWVWQALAGLLAVTSLSLPSSATLHSPTCLCGMEGPGEPLSPASPDSQPSQWPSVKIRRELEGGRDITSFKEYQGEGPHISVRFRFLCIQKCDEFVTEVTLS